MREPRIITGVLILAIMGIVATVGGAQIRDRAAARIQVILDTDIGDDIDDTWALVMLLKSPELDLKLVTTTFGKAEYRARLAAKLLTLAGRTDVAVGLGAGGRDGTGKQGAWVEDFDLGSYGGQVHSDGAAAMIGLINASAQPVTLISIGPSDTAAEALARDPGIAAKANFAGMQGSVRRGYEGGPVSAEWNVKANIPAARRALLAPWKRTVITPLDTCGLIRLKGKRFAALRASSDPLVRALMENYRLWAKKRSLDELKESSVLFDTAAVTLALPAAPAFMILEDLTIDISGEGMTLYDPAGRKMSAATAWKDLPGYEDFLVERLLRPAVTVEESRGRPDN